MRIKSLRVEEGFFDGLNLEFAEGLNVLIGGRGVGKTSVIELLRFAIGAGGLTSSAARDAALHAVSVLGSGKVFVDVEFNGELYQFSRSANAADSKRPANFDMPIVFSQTELEGIGLDAEGRLELLDSFEHRWRVRDVDIASSVAEVRSQAALLFELQKSIDELTHYSYLHTELKKFESELISRQLDFEKQDRVVEETRLKLDKIQRESASTGVLVGLLLEMSTETEEWMRRIQSAPPPGANFEYNFQNQDDKLSDSVEFEEIRRNFWQLSNRLEELVDTAKIQQNLITIVLQSLKAQQSEREDSARDLRKTVEAYAEGAGNIARDIGVIRDKIAYAEHRSNQLAVVRSKYETTVARLRHGLREIERARLDVFNERSSVADVLSNRLAPSITIKVQHSARISAYEDALKESLRGSNLRYNEVAPLIAARISPEELLDMILEYDVESFATIIGIPVDRAARMLTQFQGINISDALTAKVEDDVQFALLDGSTYKSPELMSIGQRCTVALTIILENSDRTLLIDQPEDHLDNEFIAKTLIRSLLRRSKTAQTILSSHNANIPVLGNADKVICLGSNGRRGFVECSGDLTNSKIVELIEDIMEGGKVAFERRAQFYENGGSK